MICKHTIHGNPFKDLLTALKFNKIDKLNQIYVDMIGGYTCICADPEHVSGGMGAV